MMEKKLFQLLTFTSFLLISCRSVDQTFYLQEAEVKAPMNTPAIHITKDRIPGTITFSPRINVSNFSEISANTGSIRYRDTTQDSLFRGKNKNLVWKVPTIYFGLDLDVALTHKFGLAAGINYSKINGQQLIGGSCGLAVVSEQEKIASRLDFGILVQEILYDAKSIVVTKIDYLWGDSETSISYFRDISKKSVMNIYAELNVNTKMNEFSFNFFFNLSLFTQSLLDYEPETSTNSLFFPIIPVHTETDSRGEVMSAFVSFTPGIFLEMTEWSRLVLGARLMYDFGLESSSQQFIVLPVLQYDLQF
ncbi:MAG: hypothetical protein HXY50_04460 [Ignavibacteriaceae bacterium]|nr:hypothetical protein [Ignavibacteriaceae bacterium]